MLSPPQRVQLSMLLLLFCLSGCESPPEEPRAEVELDESSVQATLDLEAQIHFKGPDYSERKSLKSLRESLDVHSIETVDPYYEALKTFQAFTLRDLMTTGFSLSAEEISTKDFLFRATDGYEVAIQGERLLEPGGFAAFADNDQSRPWERIGEREVDPGPLYLVWTEEDQRTIETHPRPWQVVAIEIVSPEEIYSHTTPLESAGLEAMKGYQIFRRDCIVCHAVNRSGGRAGPELNVPQNITEYRDKEFVLAYTRDPGTFRYSQMPAFSHLTEDDLEALWAYFVAMKDQKHIP